MSYQIFGRAIKNEYLSVGTILTTAAVIYASMGKGKKEVTHSSSSMKESIAKAKEAVPLSTSSNEEAQLMDSIKKFIEEAEKESHH